MKSKNNNENEMKIQVSMESMAAELVQAIANKDPSLLEGALEGLPVANLFINLLNTARAFKDQLFEKKLLRFLEELDGIPSETIRSEIEEIENNDDYKIKVGEKLLYIIDSSEDHETASIIGRLFAAYLKSILAFDDFISAAAIVNNIQSTELEKFLSLPPSTHGPNGEAWNYQSSDFVYRHYTKVEEVGTLVFSGLYEIRSPIGSAVGLFVIETNIAGLIRDVLSE